MPEGYGLYGGKGWSTCARASVNPARGTLRIPSTVAKAVVASIDVCRRIGVPSSPQRSYRFQAPTVTAASHVCLGTETKVRIASKLARRLLWLISQSFA